MAQYTLPKGTKDVLPSQIGKWHFLEDTLRKTAADFGFKEIRFPTFEHTELFLRGIGDTTDIVQKEMYTFEDKGGRSITLRPEGTASVVRSVVENGLYAGALPLKVYYIAPNFRYEKPQAGRLREHHQFGVESFGSANPEADAEVISLADTYLRRLGLDKIHVELNTVGCPACRPAYSAALREYFAPHLAGMCHFCQVRYEKNPLRLLDCKEEHCSALAEGAPAFSESLCEECAGHFSRLKLLLAGLDIRYNENKRIVRGLDYYTKTVFEFVADNIGAQATVCAGGRYDGLVETFGGPSLPGLGFGSGLERLLMSMEAAGFDFPKDAVPELYIGSLGEKAGAAAAELTLALRRAGVSAENDLMGRSVKAQMKYAGKTGAKHTMILGDSELAAGRAMLKDMGDSSEREVGVDAESIINLLRGAR